MPAAVIVFEQTAKSSLRVTLLASVACSGNKPVYTVMIQPNGSPESVRDGSGRQFPFRKVLLKTTLERGVSVLRWWKQSRDCFFIVHSAAGILCVFFLQGMALILLFLPRV